MSNQSCATIKNKSWPYQQYYVGERDSEGRRNGGGENHWTGAKSLEWYCGRLLRDTMHGIGEYYWRYIDREGAFVSYEGYFYCNQMHGYGTKSYPDGRVFEGLFHSNLRWGPGVECHISVRENVGLWLGNQLIRLCWRPSTTSLFLDFMATSTGRACVEAARTLMTSYSEPINKNTVIELLVEYGSDQQAAEEKWMKLQPKHCSDASSPVFPLQLFEDKYYGSGNKNILQESKKISESTVDFQEKRYFAWNNNEIIKHMMKHSFTHDTQTARTRLNISKILSGPRHNFKPPAKHELDCRTLLMASYLGETNVVVQLVNEEGIHPDVTDMQGNSVLMYAVCGEQTEIIHFLVEAGAGIDNYNDTCCTALSVALVRFICARKNISANDMTQALIPETNLPRNPSLETVSEWNLVRGVSSLKNVLTKNSSKIMKSLTSLKETSPPKNNPGISVKLEQDSISENENINKSIELFTEINNKYASKTAELYSAISAGNPISYIFEVHNITNEFEGIVEEPKKNTVKNPKRVISTTLKESVKPTNGNKRLSNDYTETKNCFNSCEQTMLTIIQLLSDGADPRLVRCPQPALFMAIASGCSNLVQKLIDHGVNVNEIYFHVLGYFPLDIAISYQATMENLEVIRILLENGADTQHRLPLSNCNSTGSLNEGPTLLHVVLEKICESQVEEEIRRQILELLLNYNCDSTEQFKGRSAIDISMAKGADIFNIFIKHPKVNLNAIINQSNQNILTKMFFLPFFKTFESKQRVEILSNLLRCGADPLKVSQNDETQFENIIVFAKKTLDELEHLEIKQNSPPGSKQENKVKKNGKNVDDKGAKQKTLVSDIEDYKLTVELVTDWARLLHIRWLRAKFIKESIKTIIKYKHRHWNMILQEIKHKKSIALWLTPQACLKIWTALKTTNKKVYDDETVLKYLFCAILYCRQHITENSIVTRISASEKMTIESDVNNFLREYKTAELVPTEPKCALPELGPSFDTKYNVCFECAMPLKSDKKLCTLCKNVSFCTSACMKLNIDRIDCHPCSDYLRKKYFTNSNDQVYVV